MSKLMNVAAATVLALVPAVGAQAAAIGPDAAACRAGAAAPAVLVHIDGFKAHTGRVRVQVYGSDPADFLSKGKRLKRIDLPVASHGAMDVCVALPAPGNYAIAVRHDINGSGKSDWNDGGGFSRNPSISLVSLKPRYQDVVIGVGGVPRPVDITLNYRRGLSIKPVAGS
ncbi:MAG: hypothetical protein JWN59_708 [Sphingomonas bacterium]|nr:hypothetical protein [Sphingomonas bacterium]